MKQQSISKIRISDKRQFAAALTAALFISGCYSPQSSAVVPVQQYEKLETIVADIDEFGDAVLDISDLAFEYGDSVDIEFSGG